VAADPRSVGTVSTPLPHEHTDHPDRLVPLESAFNVRDLGGYPTVDGRVVRWRTLYRADALHRLTDDEVTLLGERGVRTALDLRSDAEVERGQLAAERLGLTLHHLPVLGGTWAIGDLDLEGEPGEVLSSLYVGMLDVGAPAIRAALEVLAGDDALPALFHCSAGKDRTGVLAAIVLTLLGVHREVVVADYALTSRSMERMLAAMRERRSASPDWTETLQEQPSAFVMAPAEAMERFLDRVADLHGDVDGYVASIGVDPEVLDRLRDRLLESPSSSS
jgi:protein-tyrosine phosphatase